jgi:hypothetical protein
LLLLGAQAAYYETGVAFSLAVMTSRDLMVLSKDNLSTAAAGENALPRL